MTPAQIVYRLMSEAAASAEMDDLADVFWISAIAEDIANGHTLPPAIASAVQIHLGETS